LGIVAIEDSLSLVCAVYGIPLEELMSEREKDRDIPLVVEKTINYLIAKGLTAEVRNSR